MYSLHGEGLDMLFLMKRSTTQCASSTLLFKFNIFQLIDTRSIDIKAFNAITNT